MAGRLEEARSPTVEGKVAGNLYRQVADVDQATSPGTE
jgi:hypothetical protein